MPGPTIHHRSLDLGCPAIAVHGGAGTPPARAGSELDAREMAGMAEALAEGWDALEAGVCALDAVVAAVAVMEASGIFNAGRGAVRTSAGGVETDAGVMGVLPEGGSRFREVAGAACAMTWPEHPVHVARAVAGAGAALLLAGTGADDFARESGLPRRDESLLTSGGVAPISEHGTVGAVAIDGAGHLAAATSTGGRRGQRPGRVGDSPVIGAGTWAGQGTVAVSATGDGEAFIRAGFAHRIELAVAAGTGVEDAAREALAAAARWGGLGGAIVLDAGGHLVVLHDTAAMARGWRSAAGVVSEVA